MCIRDRGKEVVLPDEVKAQIEKEIADATAKIEPYIGDGNLRIIYEKHEFLVKVRNPDTCLLYTSRCV